MKKLFKISVNLALVLLLLIVCFSSITLGYTGLLLHTYNVFTEREPVAQVTVSELKNDEQGSFAEVEVQIYQFERTALTRALLGTNTSNATLTPPQKFKLYGDTIYIGGPIVKFRDELVFLNFKTMFKIGKIFARYELDNIKELNKKVNSSFDLNNGFSEWKVAFEQYQEQGIVGDIWRSIIDTTQVSIAGQMIGSRSITYTVYITNNGFLWKID